MAAEIESILFCANAAMGGAGGGVNLFGVFGATHEIRAAQFHVFTSLRGDRGRYAVRLVVEDPDGDAVASYDQLVELPSDVSWHSLSARFTVHLTRGVWTGKVYVDGKFHQLATFTVVPRPRHE